MEKLIHQFEFGLFVWQVLIFVGLIFLLKKFAWKPILDAVNDREKESKRITFCRKCKKRNAKPSDNQRILQEARMERDNMLKMHVKLKRK
jgi:F-type H+-transporting ATPase subunit b